MILFLQFTITDTRRFSVFREQVLTKPQWPIPKPFGQFVRATGAIVERKKGGLSGWVGENLICRITKSIKFEPKILFSNGVSATSVSKHMYASADYVLTKYEFVFNIQTQDRGAKVTYDIMKTIINELLLSSVKIRLGGHMRSISINRLPEVLREFHYQNVTLRDPNVNRSVDGQQNVLSCTPQCYFYLESREFSTGLNHHFKHIPNVSQVARLFGGWHDHRNNPFRIWIHQRHSKSKKIVENRDIRIQIMRLHSEYECLRNLLSAIAKKLIYVKKRSSVSDDLQAYFNTAIKTFLYNEKDLEYHSWTPGFLNYFSKIYASASKGESELLKLQIEEFNFRANIKNKVLYIQKNTFMGSKYVNVNSSILSQGDHNSIQGNQVEHKASKEVQGINFDELIKELSEIIEFQKQEAKTTTDLEAVVALSKVKDAAEKKDSNGVISAVKLGGKVLYEVGTKFTASLLVELLKANGAL